MGLDPEYNAFQLKWLQRMKQIYRILSPYFYGLFHGNYK
jgi:hypothetical protein